MFLYMIMMVKIALKGFLMEMDYQSLYAISGSFLGLSIGFDGFYSFLIVGELCELCLLGSRVRHCLLRCLYWLLICEHFIYIASVLLS